MVREHLSKFQKEFRKQSTLAMIAAFGFLIALAWRDFLSDSTNQLITSLGVTEAIYLYKFLSALLITLIAIIGIMIISKYKVEEKIK
tara:strand:+ start:1219 stop:1479 length:261 start_codon:yes stop_codon:yes gene_type:complete